LVVRNLQIWRDVYYLHPFGTAAAWEQSKALGRHEMFVLGDNSPLSNDSRQFELPLSANDFVGRVIAW
jgi:type IV secretory pathway protease TraF